MEKILLIVSMFLMANISHATNLFKHSKPNTQKSKSVTQIGDVDDLNGSYEGFCDGEPEKFKIQQDEFGITMITKETYADDVEYYPIDAFSSQHDAYISNAKVERQASHFIALWNSREKHFILTDVDFVTANDGIFSNYNMSILKKMDSGVNITNLHIDMSSYGLKYESEKISCFFEKKED